MPLTAQVLRLLLDVLNYLFELILYYILIWIIHKYLAQRNYSAGPSHREGAERPRRSHVKNPALPEEIAALAPLVRNDFFK